MSRDAISSSPHIAEQLRTWRRMSGVKQSALAHQLGVSQPTIARWEAGRDTPSPQRLAQLLDLMAGTFRDEYALERLLIQRQAAVRALIDIDGIRLSAVSQGYRSLWPQFSELLEVPFADHLVNEVRLLVDRNDLIKEIHAGSIGLISGVSQRHFDVDVDTATLHSWHMVFRRYGAKTYADIVFEPLAADTTPCVKDLVRLDALGVPLPITAAL